MKWKVLASVLLAAPSASVSVREANKMRTKVKKLMKKMKLKKAAPVVKAPIKHVTASQKAKSK